MGKHNEMTMTPSNHPDAIKLREILKEQNQRIKELEEKQRDVMDALIAKRKTCERNFDDNGVTAWGNAIHLYEQVTGVTQ